MIKPQNEKRKLMEIKSAMNHRIIKTIHEKCKMKSINDRNGK